MKSNKLTTFRVSDRSFHRICGTDLGKSQGIAQVVAGFDQDGRTEMDSHADTCVVGKQCLVFHDFDRPVNVSGFDTSLGTVKNRSVVSAALAYDDPETGEVIMLVVHQAIHIPTMDHNLLCPMQLRMSDVAVDECPKFLHSAPTDETHAIRFPGTIGDSGYLIPFNLHGVTSYFPTRRPTMDEWKNCRQFELTSEGPEWDPHASLFSDQEHALLDSNGRIRDFGDQIGRNRRFISSLNNENARFQSRVIAETSSQCGAVLNEIDQTLNDVRFVQLLKSQVKIRLPHHTSDISVASSSRGNGVVAKDLAQRWDIGLEMAEKTIESTTQRGVRTVDNPRLNRRFRTNDRQLRYRRLGVDIFTDTLEAGLKSKRGNKYAQAFGTSFGWSRAYPMRKKSEAHHGYSLLCSKVGVPDTMICDGAKEQILGDFRRKCRETDCHVKQLEPYTPWANAAEGTIRELKKGSGRKMVKKRSPKVLWDDCLEYEAVLRSHTALNLYGLQGEVPETLVTGQTADISSLAEFEWYQWVLYYDELASYPDDKQKLARWLGPSFDVGSAMTAKLLKENGNYAHRSTYRALTADELLNPDMKKRMDAFDQNIVSVMGELAEGKDFPEELDVETPIGIPYEDDCEDGVAPMPDRDDDDPEVFDNYLGAEVALSRGDVISTGKVVGRKRELDGSVKGKANRNPILDTRTYRVEFPDGAEAEYSANTIAENMWAQCDLEGKQHILMDSIIDHSTDGHAVKKADQMIVVNGRSSKKKTTKGWMLCVQWKDGTTTWERLSELKESNPVEVAEYAVAREIHTEPAFDWWVPYTLKKRDRIIAAVNNRYHKRTHKFGIELPKSITDARRLDKENGNNLWEEAIRKEMKAVQVAFKILNDGEKAPPTYQEIRCHMVFDVKMDSFARKARYVAQGNMTEAPATLTYASVVSRESVRIALTLAALNDLEVKTADIANAYLQAPVTEKISVRCGPEFGPDEGKMAILVRALYGLCSAGAAFRNHLADCMTTLGYKSCLADQDLWMKASTRPDDGFEYYTYVLLYVDDVLVVSHDGMAVLDEIDRYFPMKPTSKGDPDLYLGAKIRQVRLPNGVWSWSLSPSKYVQEAIRNVREHLKKEYDGRNLDKRASTAFAKDYRAELDVSEELGPEDASYYQSQIGVLRWMVELGRVDIITEVSMLASQMAMPRRGHLEAVFHMYAYLHNKHNSTMVFDPSYPDIDMRDFKVCDWKNFYGDVKEAIPPNAPPPRGKEVDIRLYVDSDHAGDRLTRRSRTGFFIYMNGAPIAWQSKKQATIESSVFGAEFVAMKVGMETTRGLRYKLRMMGVAMDGPIYTYGDNMSVIHNTQRPESVLKKKSNSICYHAIRESVAMGESITAHVPTQLNPADLCTKVLSGGEKRDGIISLVLYDIGTTAGAVAA